MSKKSSDRVNPKAVTTVAEGRAKAEKYYASMAPLDVGGGNMRPGGYKTFEEFLWLYLAPKMVDRLAALDRHKASHPRKVKAVRKAAKVTK